MPQPNQTTTRHTPKFEEEYSAKIPALTLLTSLGWTYLTPSQANAYRDGKQDQVILTHILRQQLAKRTFTHAGQDHPLSPQAIDSLIDTITNPPMGEGLLKANERIYNHLMYGIAVTEFVNGKKVSPTISLIDWHNIDNNDFSYTEEYTITRSGGIDNRRPDIVCFVNGIPLAVIEAKRPDAHTGKAPTIDEGISQTLRNQRHDEIPQLFAYSQLLISINGNTGRYATCYTCLLYTSPSPRDS